jgi:cytochrome bd ubiquinol oxidase subunit I
MDHVIAARAQMGTSLAFHIVFAALGVGLPLLICIAEGLWLRTGERAYYDLAKSWAKGMAILFAIGAVSGTILSFELGLLWPGFMRYAGSLIGLPFSLEGFAFFIEAIFIGIYIYGWDRLSPRAHWLCIVPVMLSGAVSAGFVTLANAWMQMPTGFRIVDGKVIDVQPLVAMFPKPWALEVTHATVGAYVFSGFALAAVCASAWLQGNRSPAVSRGLRIAMLVGALSVAVQIVVGDTIARFDAAQEPAKFAAMEVVKKTTSDAPLTVGGIPTADGLCCTIEIPKHLSFLVAFSASAKVRGLDAIPPADRPPVAATHLSFDAMVGSATLLFIIALVWVPSAIRRKDPPKWLALAIALTGPLALIALEAGWFVTEFGRQPWIAVGLQRTSDAVTPAPNLDLAFYGFSAIYVVLGMTCAWLLLHLRRGEPASDPAIDERKAPI